MKRNVRRALSALLSVVMLLSLLVVPAGAAGETAAHTVWLVGDSTVCAFNDKYYYPRYGYGTQLENYLDGTYAVQNLALSGRSSKSFLAEANYATLFGADGIKDGDALIIGFGHNDEKAEADRYTNPNGDWQTEGSFAKSLYDNYVKKAQDKGAEVILCTPIVRRNKDSDTLSDSTCHITTDAADGQGNQYPGGDYPAAIRKLGADKGVTVVDMTALTKELYESLGAAKTENFHAQTLSPKDGKARGVDNTHLNIYGAKQVAWMFANALKDVSASELGKHVDLTAGAPTEADLVSNPDYVEPTYTPPADDVVSSFPDYKAGDVTFKGTAFGELNGDKFDAANYVLETDADGNMHIANPNAKCKISSTADGMAMYYYKVPAGSKIEFSATAKINSFVDDKNKTQSGFGLMARDDMYVDTVNRSLATDYVAAGSFGSGGNCFYRKDTTLHKGPALTTEEIKVGSSYDLKIASTEDGYACTFGGETTQTGGYDFQLTATDGDYFYVGMFCSRTMDVTFSNIVLVVDGQTLCDTRPADGNFNVTDVDWTVTDGKLESINVARVGHDPAAMTLIAIYSSEGALTELKTLPLTNGVIPLDLPMEAGATAKVFVINRNNTTPFTPAFSSADPTPPANP